MEPEYRLEMDKMQKEMAELKVLVSELLGRSVGGSPGKSEKLNNGVHTMKSMHPDKRLTELMEELCQKTDDEQNTGYIIYMGVFASGGNQSNWIQNGINTDDLLALIENKTVSTVLDCIGNSDRLNILLTLLRQPMSVASLVEKCGFNSTGQVYHHLRPLIAADIVFEPEHGERGVYAVKHHRVQGIIMLLAGINDLTDTKFSHGEWGKGQE